MSGVTYFYESCPVCGRHLRIPVQHYGRLMECTHCSGEFLAGQPAANEQPAECRPVAPSADSGIIFGAHFGSPRCGEV